MSLVTLASCQCATPERLPRGTPRLLIDVGGVRTEREVFDFGEVALGNAGTGEVFLENVGDGELVLETVVKVGAGSAVRLGPSAPAEQAPFSLAVTTARLAPRQTLPLPVAFTPGTAGVEQVWLSLFFSSSTVAEPLRPILRAPASPRPVRAAAWSTSASCPSGPGASSAWCCATRLRGARPSRWGPSRLAAPSPS